MSTTLHLYAADPKDVQRAAELLCDGQLVAFATETVYGLGANAFSAPAVEQIFRAKGRPSWDPLIVHGASLDQMTAVAVVGPDLATRVGLLAEAFWPGPLTMLLPRTGAVPDGVTAGRPLVGYRVPAHPSAQALLRAAGVPVAAPSANRFGHTSPTTAQHVFDDLDGRIAAVLDAGPCRVGLESTVLDPGQMPMVIYRAGAVTPEQISAVSGVPVRLFGDGDPLGDVVAGQPPTALPSPGVGLRHYAPNAAVRLTVGTPEALWTSVRAALSRGGRVGVLLPSDWPKENTPATMQIWAAWGDPSALAAELFAGLRKLEGSGVDTIVCPLPGPGGMRDALRDRLSKAAKAG